MRLSALLGLSVHTESGERLGHVHDVRADLTQRSLRMTGIVVGGRGLLERLGFEAPGWRSRGHPRDVIDWSAVVRADRRGIVVRDGTTVGRAAD